MFFIVALSVDLEDPEVTRVKKDYDMYKMQLDNEMSSMQRRVLKYEEDNKRLRAALQVIICRLLKHFMLDMFLVLFVDRAQRPRAPARKSRCSNRRRKACFD